MSARSRVRDLVAEGTINIEGAPGWGTSDGEKLGKSPLAEPLLIGPGKHTFRAERDGEEPDEKTLELTSVTKVEVALKPRIKETLPGCANDAQCVKLTHTSGEANSCPIMARA